MTDSFDFQHGDIPLLVSIPHDGRKLAPGMAKRMTEDGRFLPDTDWHVGYLYEFANSLGASVIAAEFSRYVIDLNRSSTDEALYAGQRSTGLCATKTFAGAEIYAKGRNPDAGEQQDRVQRYWFPYHAKIKNELAALKERFGYALLWDAHSIRGEVPGLFEGQLPDLNIGTNGGDSCDSRLADAVVAVAEASNYSVAVNGRFKGGFITRHFGRPDEVVHAIQLELAQRCYMNEETGEYDQRVAESFVGTLTEMMRVFAVTASRIL